VTKKKKNSGGTGDCSGTEGHVLATLAIVSSTNRTARKDFVNGEQSTPQSVSEDV